MFISWQTHEGLQITVHSINEVCKFLLEHGVPERFCQDDLENYFGRQRAIGSRCDNPSVRDFGYNDNTSRNNFHSARLLVMFVVKVPTSMKSTIYHYPKERN